MISVDKTFYKGKPSVLQINFVSELSVETEQYKYNVSNNIKKKVVFT